MKMTRWVVSLLIMTGCGGFTVDDDRMGVSLLKMTGWGGFTVENERMWWFHC